eukprot:m.145096 g.145096  ORF g.145096 m.145096 type:complete len:231 (+) comp20483_c2_seq5:920-1612(+)
MTDHAQDQADELEALESIFADEFTLKNPGETPASFFVVIPVDTEPGEDPVHTELHITYTESYPEDVPVIKLENSEGLEEETEAELMEHIQAQAQENIGTAMVFTLHAAAKEWIETRLQRDRDDREAKKKAEEEEKLRRELEEATKGTLITPESFRAWWADFRETELPKYHDLSGMKKKTRPTGRQLFEADSSLQNSDLALSSAEEQTVEVDMAVFEGLDLDDIDAELDDE